MLHLTDELCCLVLSQLPSHTTMSLVSKKFRDLTKKTRDAAKAEKHANAQAVLRETFPNLFELSNDCRGGLVVRGRYTFMLRAFIDFRRFNIIFEEGIYHRNSEQFIDEMLYLIKDGHVYEIMPWGGLLRCGPLAKFVVNHRLKLYF